MMGQRRIWCQLSIGNQTAIWNPRAKRRQFLKSGGKLFRSSRLVLSKEMARSVHMMLSACLARSLYLVLS
jgi:hypothetical protein